MGSKFVIAEIVIAFLCASWSVSGKTIVTHLPGFSGLLPFELETGYVKVDETRDINLFHYFVKSEKSPSEDPLVLWLTGGDCSGLFSLMYEVGPLGFDVENYKAGEMPTIYHRKSAWTRSSSMIFIDSPVGIGFSYTSMPNVEDWLDSIASTRLQKFIRKWLLDHPEFISNPFYVAGNSYGGKLAPLFADKVVNGNEAGELPPVNFKGYLVGNAATGVEYFETGFKIPWSHGMGLISNNLYEAAKLSCEGEYFTPRNAQCSKYVEAIEEVIKGINVVHILEPKCDTDFTRPENRGRALNNLQTSNLSMEKMQNTRCRDYGYLVVEPWANTDEVQKSIGVNQKWTRDWIRCKNDGQLHISDVPSVIPYHQSLTKRGYRALVFSGDHDQLANLLGTQAWLSTLNYSIINEWRPWWFNGQIAGFTEIFENNLTYATIKGAGHSSSEYKPDEVQAMFERWITGMAL